jgi:hypothetical protein
MAVKVRVAVKRNGEPDMRLAANRLRFLKDPDTNLDGSADVRLSLLSSSGMNERRTGRVTRPSFY